MNPNNIGEDKDRKQVQKENDRIERNKKFVPQDLGHRCVVVFVLFVLFPFTQELWPLHTFEMKKCTKKQGHTNVRTLSHGGHFIVRQKLLKLNN